MEDAINPGQTNTFITQVPVYRRCGPDSSTAEKQRQGEGLPGVLSLGMFTAHHSVYTMLCTVVATPST